MHAYTCVIYYRYTRSSILGPAHTQREKSKPCSLWQLSCVDLLNVAIAKLHPNHIS